MHCCLSLILNQLIRRARSAPRKSWANDFCLLLSPRERPAVPRRDAARARGKKTAKTGSGVPRLSTPLYGCGPTDCH